MVDKLYVKMLGEFSIEYQGKVVLREEEGVTKMMQLLLMLLYAGQDGIGREEVISKLYARESSQDPGATLRVNLYRLRKYIGNLGIKCDGGCILVRGGKFKWNSAKIPVVLDTEEFCGKILLAGEEKNVERKAALLIQACQLYQGSFLPMLADEGWVAVENHRYQELYSQALREAAVWLKQKQDYERLLVLSFHACRLNPYEEWYLLQIDCLMALGRYREAMDAYGEAAHFYFEKLGLRPSAEMLERFNIMSGLLRYDTMTIEDVQKELQEQKERKGAYFCTYPGFADSYHVVRRLLERTGQTALLMLCTLADRKGNPFEDDNRLESYMEKLKESIGKALRKGDFYTKCGVNQFLVMMAGISEEDWTNIQKRVNSCFHNAESRMRASIQFITCYATDGEKENGKIRLPNSAAWEEK